MKKVNIAAPTNARVERQIKHKSTEMFFNRKKKEIVSANNGSGMDLYISKHFLDRVVDRRLINDIEFMASMLSYFMEAIYYGTSQCNKRFVLRLRNLRLGIELTDNRTVSGYRQAVVTTVMDNDADEWFCHEEIELKPQGSIKHIKKIYE